MKKSLLILGIWGVAFWAIAASIDYRADVRKEADRLVRVKLCKELYPDKPTCVDDLSYRELIERHKEKLYPR